MVLAVLFQLKNKSITNLYAASDAKVRVSSTFAVSSRNRLFRSSRIITAVFGPIGPVSNGDVSTVLHRFSC